MGRKRKHTDGKYDRQRTDLNGRTVGGSGVIGVVLETVGMDKHGHRYVLVQWFCNPKKPDFADRSCPVCHGKPVKQRWDYLSGKNPRIKSCGRLKKKRYKDHIEKMKQYPVIDVNGNPIPATARLKRPQ